MTPAAVKPRVSFEEYIDFGAQTDERYERVRGNLRQMNPPTGLHYRIAKFLEQVLDQAIADHSGSEEWETFREAGQRTEHDSSRLPDLAIVSKNLLQTLHPLPCLLSRLKLVAYRSMLNRLLDRPTYSLSDLL